MGPKFQAGHEDPNQVALQNEPLITNSPVSGDVVYAALVRTLYSSVRCHPYCLFLPRPHSTGCCFGTWLRCCGLVPSPRSSRSTSSNRPYRQKRISRGTAAQACSRQSLVDMYACMVQVLRFFVCECVPSLIRLFVCLSVSIKQHSKTHPRAFVLRHVPHGSFAVLLFRFSVVLSCFLSVSGPLSLFVSRDVFFWSFFS